MLIACLHTRAHAWDATATACMQSGRHAAPRHALWRGAVAYPQALCVIVDGIPGDGARRQEAYACAAVIKLTEWEGINKHVYVPYKQSRYVHTMQVGPVSVCAYM